MQHIARLIDALQERKRQRSNLFDRHEMTHVRFPDKGVGPGERERAIAGAPMAPLKRRRNTFQQAFGLG